MLAVPNPREHLRPLALSRPAIPPSPLSDRVGYSDHDRFRGYIPVHFIPAYNLPVYASQRPLPDATQDSVRGCLLGFAAAVIADGRLQRACKAQPAQIRTGPIRAYGLYGAFFVKGITPFLSSFVIPFFCSTRAASILPSRPHISIAVARSGGQGRRFFSAAEGLSLTAASTAAGCRRSGGWPRDDPRGACHWPRPIARTMLVFG